jgi:hypothetical protein
MQNTRGFHPTMLAGMLALLAAPPLARAAVFVVDPGADAWAALKSAIQAAADGDTLELLPGAWSFPQSPDPVQLLVDGKGLTIVSSAEPRPVLESVVIQNLPAGSRFVLRGIDVAPVFPAGGNFVDAGVIKIDHCLGSVWVEDCHAAAPAQPPGDTIFNLSKSGEPGAGVTSSTAVSFLRCSLTGGAGATANGTAYGFATSGGAGLNVRASSVSVHQCTLQAGKCGFGSGSNLVGAAGLSVDVGSSVLLAGGSAAGGDLVGTAVGNGLLVKDALSTARVRDAAVQAGAGGGVAILAPSGTVTMFPAPARSLSIPCPLHAQQPTALTVDGVQGDLVAVFAATNGAMLFLPSHQGAFELAPPLLGPFVLGANPDPAGHWVLPIVPPGLPAGELGQTWLLQLVVNDGAHTLFEGGTSFVDLDASLP